jgi:hypothetical protein
MTARERIEDTGPAGVDHLEAEARLRRVGESLVRTDQDHQPLAVVRQFQEIFRVPNVDLAQLGEC